MRKLFEKLKTSGTKVFKPGKEQSGSEEYVSLSASNLFEYLKCASKSLVSVSQISTGIMLFLPDFSDTVKNHTIIISKMVSKYFSA